MAPRGFRHFLYKQTSGVSWKCMRNFGSVTQIHTIAAQLGGVR
jgi:hypothetical protein